MKKFLGLFMLLMIAIFAKINAVKAEEPMLYGSVNAKFSGEVRGDDIKRMLPPGQKIPEGALPQNVKFKGEIKDGRMQLHEDIKLERGEMHADIQGDREAMRADIKDSDKTPEERKTERETFKKEVEAKKIEFRANIKEKRTEFRMKAKEILVERFQNAIQKLEDIQARVASRIAKVKAEGKDITSAETALTNSKAKLEAAKAKLAEVKAILPSTDAEVTADLFEKIKVGTREAQDLLKESRSELKNAIDVLKALWTPEVKVEGSTENKVEAE